MNLSKCTEVESVLIHPIPRQTQVPGPATPCSRLRWVVNLSPSYSPLFSHMCLAPSFLYLSNPPVAPALVSAVISWIPRLFALSQEEKDRIAISNTPHFLGYSRLGSELTKGATDLREQFDFASPHQNKWTPGAPEFLKLWGDAQVRTFVVDRSSGNC